MNNSFACSNTYKFPQQIEEQRRRNKGLKGSPGFTVSAVAVSGTCCIYSGGAEMPEGNPRRNKEDAEQRACGKSCSISTVRDAETSGGSLGASSSPEMLHNVL